MQKHCILFGFFLGLLCLTQAVPVRLTNACMDCGGFDLIVEERIVFSNVQYQDLTGIVLHWPGTRAMQIRRTGTMDAIATFKINLNMENPITISVINFNEEGLNFFVNYDWAGSGPDFDEIAIKAVNLSPNVGEIEVLDRNGNVIIRNLGFLGRSEYVYLPYGDHFFTFRRVSNGDVLFTTPTKSIGNWKVNSLFFYGDVVAEDYHVNYVVDEFHGYDLDIDGSNTPFTNPQLSA